MQSEWKPFSELKTVQQSISELGYKKEYIEKHKLEETKIFHCCNTITGVINFFEPLEVKKEGGEIFWRYNEARVSMDIPETFETQFGIFNNHNHGEFPSWLGKDDYEGLPEKEKEIHRLFGRSDFFLYGNYCDMFDCGEYVYAISNLTHMGSGKFKILRIDKNLTALEMYDNYSGKDHTHLEYAGRFPSAAGYVVIAGGIRETECKEHKSGFQKIALLFTIDENGNCSISNEWNISISSVNSMAALGDHVYFGQNKMVSRMNILSGEIEFFTNKTDEEISTLTAVL